ncbi:MAG: lysophospholipid acyltransferase family protein [Flavobacteriales bacterium]
MAALLYYLVVFPLSLLPLRLLYSIAKGIAWIFWNLLPYRKKVILENLDKAFPNLEKGAINALAKDYYRFLAQLIVETIKNFSFTKQELLARISIENPEILTQVQALPKPIILVSSHFNNWEWLISALGLWTNRPTYGIGMPLSTAFWDQKLTEKRERFGLKVVHAANYQPVFKQPDSLILVLADQAPADAKKAYWTHFLGQETPVIFGPEYLANRYDCAVVYASVKQTKTGYYKVKLEVITEEAKAENYGDITQKHLALLSTSIAAEPSRWLWSHKRWKRSKPADLHQLMAQAKADFHAKFRSKS